MAPINQSQVSRVFSGFSSLPNELQTQIVLNNIQNQYATTVKCVEIPELREPATVRTIRPEASNAATLVDKVMRCMHERDAARNTIYRFHVDGIDLLNDATEDTAPDTKWASAIGPLHAVQRAEIIVDYHFLCESSIAPSNINIRRSVHNLVHLLSAFTGAAEISVVFLCSGSYERLMSGFVIVEEAIKRWEQVQKFSLVIAEESPDPEDITNDRSKKAKMQRVIGRSVMTDGARKARRARSVTIECIQGHTFHRSMQRGWDLKLFGHVEPRSLKRYCSFRGYPWKIATWSLD